MSAALAARSKSFFNSRLNAALKIKCSIFSGAEAPNQKGVVRGRQFFKNVSPYGTCEAACPLSLSSSMWRRVSYRVPLEDHFEKCPPDPLTNFLVAATPQLFLFSCERLQVFYFSPRITPRTICPSRGSALAATARISSRLTGESSSGVHISVTTESPKVRSPL